MAWRLRILHAAAREATDILRARASGPSQVEAKRRITRWETALEAQMERRKHEGGT